MKFRPRLVLAALPTLLSGTILAAMSVTPASASSPHRSIDCSEDYRCLEVQDWKDAGFEYYVGHDEPSLLFYSNQPGSGNHQTYNLTLPTDPVTPPNASGAGSSIWSFQEHPAFWFGMALCNPDSYPEVTQTCNPDTDANIQPMAKAPGVAFLELQFYPPGYFPVGCTATKWCAAMVIWSLAEDPIHGTTLNAACTSAIGGSIEYPNLAYLTHNGVPTGPPNALQLNGNSFTVSNNWALFNQGDQLQVSIHDSKDGLVTAVNDLTHPADSGSMVASKSNGFGTIQYEPQGTACTLIPYSFHPMYSTSQPPTMAACPSGVYPNNAAGGHSTAPVCAQDGTGTRVQWAAHSYNVAFADEIGHFNWCSNIVESGVGSSTPTGGTLNGFGTGHCGNTGHEGSGLTLHTDADDGYNCYTGKEGADFADLGGPVAGADGSGAKIPGCLSENDGFDGASYLATSWPGGPNANTPTPITFSSPLTGNSDTQAYQSVAYEADIPRITAINVTEGDCSRLTGTQWTRDPVSGGYTNTGNACAVPPTDDLGNSVFYPTFGTSGSGAACRWQEGDYANPTTQYGQSLWKLSYLAFGGGGLLSYRFNDVNHNLGSVPC